MVDLQVIGGGVETKYFSNEDVKARALAPGQTIEGTMSLNIFSQGESSREKDGKTYSDKFPLYKASLYLPDVGTPAAKAA